jgi:hypothetical protein
LGIHGEYSNGSSAVYVYRLMKRMHTRKLIAFLQPVESKS